MMDSTTGSLRYSDTKTRYHGMDMYDCGGDQSFGRLQGEKDNIFFPHIGTPELI